MISYRDTIDGIRPEHLEGFFEGWPSHPTPERHLELLQNSQYVVLAWDDSAQRVVGFISAVSDRVLSAYIPLLEVLASYRGQGIGTELARRMRDRLSGLYMVDLTCDSDVQPFYEQLGFRQYSAMILRRYENQGGA